MSDIKFACPSCDQHLDCDESGTGSEIDCPSCGNRITIPAATGVSTESDVDLTPREPSPPETDAPKGDPNVPIVDEALARPELCDKARALLLLRICQFAQVLRPEVLRHYWPKLCALGTRLPSTEQEAFQALRAAIEPPPPATLGRFAQEIVGDVERAATLSKSDASGAANLFSDCETRLRKRWWPFGKAPAWNLLVQRWCELDRQAGLERLSRLRAPVQKNLLIRLHDQRALGEADWEQAQQSTRSSGGTLPALCDVLDREVPDLHVSGTVATSLGMHLRGGLYRTSVDPTQSRKLEREREQALHRYFKLVRIQASRSTTGAEQLMEELFLDEAKPQHYQNDWVKRFTQINQIIHLWSALGGVSDAAMSFLERSAPTFLRDFALATWHAAAAASADAAAGAWQTLQPLCSDKLNSETWFLATLVRRGMPAAALELARTSTRSPELLPQVRRAWLCNDPASAKSAIRPEDLAGDLIGAFLLLNSVDERVEFLRRETNEGRQSLPDAMWRRPSFSALLPLLMKDSKQEKPTDDHCLLRLYSRNEAPETQFKHYVRLHGYGQYGYEELDPYLLVTLVAWDEARPAEVERLLQAMHAKMKPEKSELMMDVLRNSIFERYQNVFPARPGSFDEVFVHWLKKTLVDNSVQNHTGNTIQTLSLKDVVPFLYCLIGAEKLAKIAPSRCDDLLTRALRYKADADLMPSAAQLFASDKGLAALQPPAPVDDASLVEAWQVGVVGASSYRLLNALKA